MQELICLDGGDKGVLQASNRMAIEELLNPLDEEISMDGATDEDIYIRLCWTPNLKHIVRMRPQTTFAITILTMTHLAPFAS